MQQDGKTLTINSESPTKRDLEGTDCTDISATNAKDIDNDAFEGCKQLKSVDFPKLTEIGVRAFQESGLESIHAPEVKRIQSLAFQDCHQLESVDFPKLTGIGNAVFRGCKQLKSANLPILDTIQRYMFEQSGLQSIHAPQVKLIDHDAFDGCHFLESAYFPECKDIAREAFVFCNSLKSASFPECEDIAREAFRSCEELSSVFIPKIKSISVACFWGSTNLKRLVVSQALIDKHDPERHGWWWKEKGINPQRTKITSVEIWAKEQNIEAIDNDSLLMLCLLNNDPDYRPSWPEIGRRCPNMPFHLLVKHCPEDKRSSLPTLSKKIQDTTQPKTNKDLLLAYMEQLRIGPSDKISSQIGAEYKDIGWLTSANNIKTFTLKDIAKILYAATKEIDKTLKGPSGPGKNTLG